MATPTKSIDAQEAEWNANVLDVILHKVTKIDNLVAVQQRQELMLEKLTEAVSKLAVIEDRQNSDRQLLRETAQENKDYIVRLHERLDKHEERIDILDKHEVDNKRVRNWVFAIVGLTCAAVMAKIFGFIGLKEMP